MLLSHSYDVALQYASGLHRRQWRKGTHSPYISHLLAVSSLVMEYGGTETEAIAALLHDAAEDQGGKERLEEIRVHFGEDVARIVNDCTDAWTEPKPDWRPRKEEYIAALEHKPLPSLRARAGITGRWRRCFPEDCRGAVRAVSESRGGVFAGNSIIAADSAFAWRVGRVIPW